ncbi:hypothetical protein D9M69_503390 [compost metagenome]
MSLYDLIAQALIGLFQLLSALSYARLKGLIQLLQLFLKLLSLLDLGLCPIKQIGIIDRQ